MEPRKSHGEALQLWGGFECTVNRVGDRFCDQFEKSGHFDRPRDLDLAAGLGIRALRYPVLCERTAPRNPDERDWGFPDVGKNLRSCSSPNPILYLRPANFSYFLCEAKIDAVT